MKVAELREKLAMMEADNDVKIRFGENSIWTVTGVVPEGEVRIVWLAVE